MRCGLLGRKLAHSYSRQIHAELGDYSYALFEKEPEELYDFLKNGEYDCINVTIPYKKVVIPYCAAITPNARQLGAVNTIVKLPDGRLVGHNSDYFGFSYLLKKSGLQVSGKKVLILGSGGSSVTAVSVLGELGAKTVVISRTGENNYQNLDLHKDAYLIVNTTPVGMYPNNGKAALSLQHFPQLAGVLDLVYNPERTALILEAEHRGIVAISGLSMLVAQAKESAEWFTDHSISDDVIDGIVSKIRAETENLILIGMPGCGKTTIGRLLSDKLHRPFLDADDEVPRRYGKTPSQIITEQGENCFREVETQLLGALGKLSGSIIATGGGCVTREENYDSLHQNGKIIWIQRDLSGLPTDGRPLSVQNGVEELYRKRKPMYEHFADLVICNDTTEDDAADRIIKELGL